MHLFYNTEDNLESFFLHLRFKFRKIHLQSNNMYLVGEGVPPERDARVVVGRGCVCRQLGTTGARRRGRRRRLRVGPIRQSLVHLEYAEFGLHEGRQGEGCGGDVRRRWQRRVMRMVVMRVRMVDVWWRRERRRMRRMLIHGLLLSVEMRRWVEGGI